MKAKDAIRAARNYRRWGEYATFRFLEKRNIPMNMFYIALGVETKLKAMNL